MLLYVLIQLVSKRILEVNITHDLLINIYIPIGYLYFWLPQGNVQQFFIALTSAVQHINEKSQNLNVSDAQ